MWLLAASIYFACKVLTWSQSRTAGVSAWRQWAYLLAWPGMNAARFFASGDARGPQSPSSRECIPAAVNLVAGAIIFWTAQYWLPASSPLVLGWAGMIGVVLMLHFGSFHLMSCFWRGLGIDAPPLMNQPTHSTSVTDFWGRRWNTAFRDLTYQFLFRPLHTWLGAAGALVVGFIASGIVHDVVISVPAEGGYGRPTAYFAIQAAAILFERSRVVRAFDICGSWRGWLFTALTVLIPAPLLFHEPFITKIVLPFMQALGA